MEIEEASPEPEVDPFLRPTSAVTSLPATPFHFPSLLSPIPNTPRRVDSCRTPNYMGDSYRTPNYLGDSYRTPKYQLMEDLKLTSDESDFSDFEKTPKASDSDRFRYALPK